MRKRKQDHEVVWNEEFFCFVFAYLMYQNVRVIVSFISYFINSQLWITKTGSLVTWMILNNNKKNGSFSSVALLSKHKIAYIRQNCKCGHSNSIKKFETRPTAPESRRKSNKRIFALRRIQSLGINLAANILGSSAVLFRCNVCGRVYRHRENLSRHQRLECGKEANLHCRHCQYKTKHKHDLVRHQRNRHADFRPLSS